MSVNLKTSQYLVTEFVDGGTLRDWAKAEKHTWRQIVELLTGVADGSRPRMPRGFCIADIKPANILVAQNRLRKVGRFWTGKAYGKHRSPGTRGHPHAD